jgi:hypothetical protein
MASDKIPLQIVNAISGMLDSWEENYLRRPMMKVDFDSYSLIIRVRSILYRLLYLVSL